jgi:hypothetical protein
MNLLCYELIQLSTVQDVIGDSQERMRVLGATRREAVLKASAERRERQKTVEETKTQVFFTWISPSVYCCSCCKICRASFELLHGVMGWFNRLVIVSTHGSCSSWRTATRTLNHPQTNTRLSTRSVSRTFSSFFFARQLEAIAQTEGTLDAETTAKKAKLEETLQEIAKKVSLLVLV